MKPTENAVLAAYMAQPRKQFYSSDGRPLTVDEVAVVVGAAYATDFPATVVVFPVDAQPCAN